MARSLYLINPRSAVATYFGEAVRDHCDVLVTGELEAVAETLFADHAGGSWPEQRRMWKTVWEAMQEMLESEPMVMEALLRYAQVRTLYETGHFWEPRVAAGGPALGPPPAGAGDGLVRIGSGATGS